ncbi:hypothetical protein HLH33_19840 [Gluconacetobacter diazotrophicus]|uniref:Uncharacterized protein n=1 Tax=Gluconacetobacter diazotrophicus TaxID=33996 RepID=A0A7W4NIR6_GLUDI|nr:hypothetical protein [Gluconacetobacter diazotrophicus]MBB2158502.1 hypothetical protein [Gluconacetobacter diazotrophicus]
MECYFQGCTEDATTKEHIPPRSFFPQGENDQLLTVRSCKIHNNDKSKNDTYVLAHICMNAPPESRAKEIFDKTVRPQLSHNNDALARTLLKDSREVSGGISCAVDCDRLDEFFTALSCGLIYKSQKKKLPSNYRLGHIYHQLSAPDDILCREMQNEIDKFYDGKPLEPDPKVFEQYQPVVIHPSLRRDGVNGDMDWYCPT